MKFEFKMSSIGSCKGDLPFNRDEACKYITLDERPVLYTHGISYRNPAIYKKPISKEEALKILKSANLLDISTHDGYIYLHAYYESDMW